MLSKVLALAGINESGVFITNALSCRPPVGVPPDRQGIDACRPRLIREVTSYPRQLVIALGNTALRSLTGEYGLKITNERGKARRVRFGGVDLTVVPTFHPALVLRNQGEFPRLLGDMRYAASLLNGVSIKSPGTTQWDLVKAKNISRVLAFLLKQLYLAADIETAGFDPRTDAILVLSVAWAKNRVAVFPLDHPLDSDGSLVGMERTLKELFTASGPRWVWHNGKFDTAFLRTLGINARVDEDCMLLHYALNEQRGTHDLAQLGADYLGAPNWKNAMFEEAKAKGYVTKKADSFANIPPNILYPYNARDADLTLQLFHKLKAEMSESRNKGLLRLYESLLIPASDFLQEVERYGIWVSKPYLYELEREYLKDEANLLGSVTEALRGLWDPKEYARVTHTTKVPDGFNPGSPKQVLYVLRRLGYKVKDTREDTLEHLPLEHPFITALLEYRGIAKAISTYVYGIMDRIGPDGRVHSSYLEHGTTTGRLSSRNPNMQNIPRDARVRNMFQAPEGRVLIELDYAQAELRVLAYFSGDDFLASVFREGRDLHDEVAQALFGANFTREQRVRAKFVNFGIAYGRGADSLVAEFGMSREEAKRIVSDWWRRAPKADRYIRECRSAVTAGKTLVTPFGRRRRFGLVTRENLNALQNEAANFPIQSTTSDLTLLSAMKMRDHLVNSWDAHIINLVHDSILIEAPEGKDVQDLCNYATCIMEDLPRKVLHADIPIPFVVDAQVGKRWGQLKL